MKRPGPIRESVTTIGQDGSRPFLQPAIVFGSWWKARRAVAWLLIAFFAALPWIEIEGFPAVFLDVEHRRFHLFGLRSLPPSLPPSPLPHSCCCRCCCCFL